MKNLNFKYLIWIVVMGLSCVQGGEEDQDRVPTLNKLKSCAFNAENSSTTPSFSISLFTNIYGSGNKQLVSKKQDALFSPLLSELKISILNLLDPPTKIQSTLVCKEWYFLGNMLRIPGMEKEIAPLLQVKKKSFDNGSITRLDFTIYEHNLLSKISDYQEVFFKKAKEWGLMDKHKTLFN